MVENGKEHEQWEAEEFGDDISITDEELARISKIFYDVLEETIEEGSMARAYINDEKRNGMRAWRRLTGRYDTKKSADKEAAYQRVLDPGRYIGRAKNAEGALDALTKWEGEIAKYESRFGKRLEEDTMKVKVREIMPEALFGESGPFRGKRFADWEELRAELVISGG